MEVVILALSLPPIACKLLRLNDREPIPSSRIELNILWLASHCGVCFDMKCWSCNAYTPRRRARKREFSNTTPYSPFIRKRVSLLTLTTKSTWKAYNFTAASDEIEPLNFIPRFSVPHRGTNRYIYKNSQRKIPPRARALWRLTPTRKILIKFAASISSIYTSDESEKPHSRKHFHRI